ncbi:deoxyribonuclease IV [Mesotoga sp. BH458_6_3_2_1]|uniref:deoxyribonuclease IV n=1 Tax=Mesotoga sp. BH458_6_3_2_1 TaxID=1437446 RepID=UPI000EF1EC3C|nr:deoxyribonuclease IV [Mesotoga sp. BH458_6_3_2_1]RLL87656.1 endonuclease IV [Mesotoga sp. BH458_6_3_2_1]
MIRLGAHMSTSKGFDKVPKDTVAIGGNTFQIFPHSPRMWRASLPKEEMASSFIDEMKEKSLDPFDCMVHSGYLVNIASPNEEVWEKSVNLLSLEMKITAALGLKYLNFHPGSHLGDGLQEGVERILKGLEMVLGENQENDVILLLENVAAKGNHIGSSFDELEMIIEGSAQPERIGITYDTCHGFDSGFEIRTNEGVLKLIDEIDSKVGYEKLMMIHLNDSKFPLGAAKDRHEMIGKGYIGKEDGFRVFLSNERIQEKPWLLETPGDDADHALEIKYIRELLG